ncbi:MAG TPA: undecaprenyldiphospho-muramoylpentapeptide beta-N-acetylglucosaminyltransferase, partial [Clostridiales bacterium]|nr:undecaprenyldiphospho-muramoylpentapeptide beta-N-acetylglucosaminyltransferase [Clostridiales bacterium]
MRLLVSGGGTGGHVYPALAIAGAVREQDPGVEILYVGTADGLEADIVPEEGLPFEAIPSRGLVG